MSLDGPALWIYAGFLVVLLLCVLQAHREGRK